MQEVKNVEERSVAELRDMLASPENDEEAKKIIRAMIKGAY